MTTVSPSFPVVPREPFWSSDEAAAEAAVLAIERWRVEFASWLTHERDDAISKSLATLLLEVLGDMPTSSFERYSHHLSRYPTSAASLRAILLWRAGLVDFLSDVWDTMGDADFGIEECARASALLTPPPPDAHPRCPLCLGQQGDRHFEACAVQLAWRRAEGSLPDA